MSDALPPFQQFLEDHSELVWRFLVSTVGRTEAEDCFQETFIAALRAYPHLQADKRRHNPRAWVLTIAHRKSLDAHRARARREVPVHDVALVSANRSASGRARSDGRELTAVTPPARDDALWGAVERLPERQRSAVVLRYVADLPHREIATAIGCSEEAARRSLHEGLSNLRKTVNA